MTDVKLDEAWRLHRAGELEKAASLYREIIRSNPRSAEALQRLGFLHGQCGRWEEAQHFIGKAIEINPQSAETQFLRGTALQRLMRHADAVVCFNHAVMLRPNFAEALLNRASALFRLRRYDEAAADYSRLLELDPHFPFARGNRLFCELHCCDWHLLEQESAAIVAALRAGGRVIAPFDLKALTCTPEDELTCVQTWLSDQYPSLGPPLWSGERYGHDKIRVAYVSADFREGPIATLLTDVIESHDRTKFDCVGVSLSGNEQSAARWRFQKAFPHFLDASGLGDFEVASRLRQMEIDIAVDLMGYTEGCRPAIYKHRPSPIQVNYLGFPGTLGNGFHDYILADQAVIPESQQRYYAEKVVYLPDSFLPRDAKSEGLDRSMTRSSAGLPVEGFVFASFNNAYKITPPLFDIWMRLLNHVPHSVLWLTQLNNNATANLRNEATARGIDERRLIFAPYMTAQEDHFARLRLADLVLDTLPYNAHTTASDALWAGVPVLTCVGATFAGRVAASLLRAIQLPELITDSLDNYETMALKLAQTPPMLKDIKIRLEKKRTSSNLFATERFARHLEAAFTTMWLRHQRGDGPAHFAVEALPQPDQGQ